MGKEAVEQVERNAEIVAFYESTAHLPLTDRQRLGYGRLAKRFGVSRVRIGQIVKRAKKRKEASDEAKP